MSRSSSRKVKLTSKFEEFSTSRLANIQRLAHNESQKPATPVPVRERDLAPTPTRAPAVAQTPARHPAPTPTRAPAPTPTRAMTTTPTPSIALAPSVTPTSHLPMPKLTVNGKIRGRPRKCWVKAETVVKPVSSTREELLRLREENTNLRLQLEQKNNEFEELQRNSSYTGQTVPKSDYDDLKETYQRDMTHAKRHEWCVVCLSPSRYYCCWNTTYCSQKCQVEDWYARHGKSCERRKSELNSKSQPMVFN